MPRLELILQESSIGYSLFEKIESNSLYSSTSVAENSMLEFNRVSKSLRLFAFEPFKSIDDALHELNNINNSAISEKLSDFILRILPKKKKKIKLGIADTNLAKPLSEIISPAKCIHNEEIEEDIRNIRQHFSKFIQQENTSFNKSKQFSIGLGHSYSRAKIKFDVKRNDKPILQSIAIVDQLDKDINTFSMRLKEWYSWHFPELSRVVSDNYLFTVIVNLIENKNKFYKNNTKESILDQLEEILSNRDVANDVYHAMTTSTGIEMSELDMINIKHFVRKIINIYKLRTNLQNQLNNKMQAVAPNLTEVLGQTIAARLIAHAGSLSTLAKYPASTVQILGAEKALFRALKTKCNTPKYGLLQHTSYIGRANKEIKGKVSRFLANKCSIACRIDQQSENPNSIYGQHLKKQIDEKILFYSGALSEFKSNEDVMKEATEKQKQSQNNKDIAEVDENDKRKEKKRKKKKKHDKEKDEDEDELNDSMELMEINNSDEDSKKDKKERKKKKHKK